MKYLKRSILIIALLAATSAIAIDFISSPEFIIEETNSLPNETWLSAEQIIIAGGVSNDLFATTTEASLNGTFAEDVWCVGDQISAAGIFLNSTRILSRTAQIQGTHYGPVIAAGTTVKIDRTAILYNDLICFGENIILEGSVGKTTRAIATQQVTLGGQFKGDVSIVSPEIVILPGTIFNGDVSYTSTSELSLPASAIVSGEITRRFEEKAPARFIKENPALHYIFGLAALVTGLVFTGLFPRYTAGAQQVLKTSRGLSAIVGFAALFMIPMAALMLMFTLVGTPLSILMICFYLILLYLSKIIVAITIGSTILRRQHFDKKKAAAPMALGLLVIYTLTLFTAAGIIINTLVIILGLGALILALFKKPVLIIQTPDSIQPNTPEA